MVRDEKSIKDNFSTPLLYKDKSLNSGSYTKINKLVSALYIVTDIIDKEEPLRNKLRTLGADIISDMYSNFSIQESHLNKISARIDEILSFLDIAGVLNLISEMNSDILKKEFLELKQSIKALNPAPVLAELFKEEDIPKQSTRIGVQKGSTLMKALSDRIPVLSEMNNKNTDKPPRINGNGVDSLKSQRRNEIIKIIKDSNGNQGNLEGLTITDIKSKIQGSLASSSEKTLQRELFSMVQDNVLNKIGSKRWSRYFLPQ